MVTKENSSYVPLIALAACVLVSENAFAVDSSNLPLSPRLESASFHFADTNLTADLIASEPDVVSPVCAAWDADGRLFVAEMSDYPTDPTGGRVRLLEDRDGDGRYDRVTVFADKLPFPTSVLPWRDGVLVAAAPDIWFLKDADGDGKADERRVLFTGFGEGNQQLRVNGLTWGMDNWVYGANGRSDGDVRWVAQAFQPAGSGDFPVTRREVKAESLRFDSRAADERATELESSVNRQTGKSALQKTVSIRRRDFRFLPDTGQFEAIAGQSQFGTTFDDWGNRFLSWNTMPFRHVVIETRYLDRVPQLAAAESSQNLQPPGDDGRIFPLTAPPQVFNNESQTHFNASAGTTVYRGDALGELYKGNLFAGEPLRNLVHRRVLVPKGVTFEARRGEDGQEFLASTDPWFHPVNFVTGPDGALYVVDFYRQFVEHPGYVPEAMRTNVDWRVGAEHGRIWRIRPKNWKPARPHPNLSRAKSGELVRHLEDANAWWRVTAQRLLVERQDKTIVPALEKLARQSRFPLGRLHALWTLEGLRSLAPGAISDALRDRHPRVRENAVRVTEDFLAERISVPASANPPAGGALEQLKRTFTARLGDTDLRVRLQCVLTSGKVDPAGGFVWPPGDVFTSAVGDRWQSLALLSAAGSDPLGVWSSLSEYHPDWFRDPSPEQADFLQTLALLVGGDRHEGNVQVALKSLITARNTPFADFVLFNGLADGAKSNPLLKEFRAGLTQPMDSSDQTRSRISTAALRVAVSRNLSLPVRTAAIRVLGKVAPDADLSRLVDLLSSREPEEIQLAALRAMTELNDPKSSRLTFARWRNFSRAMRRQLLGSASRSSAFATALLEGLENGQVHLTEVDPSTRRALEQSPNAALKERAQRLFRGAVSADREAVLKQFEPATALTGDRAKGAAIFGRSCLQCHAMQGQGNAIGPNIYSVASQPKETLLVNVLDPSRQVTPDFVSYTVITTDGETFTGLITDESASSVRLRRPNAPDATIERSRISELKADGKSLMPDGLEQGLTPQDMADLLEFIRQPDDRLLPGEK